MGFDLDANNIPDLNWFGNDGNQPRWNDPSLRTLCFQLDGSEEKSKFGDYQLFIILNADWNIQSIKLPNLTKKKWHRVIDTSLKTGEDFLDSGKERVINPSDYYIANPRSTVVLISK